MGEERRAVGCEGKMGTRGGKGIGEWGPKEKTDIIGTWLCWGKKWETRGGK